MNKGAVQRCSLGSLCVRWRRGNFGLLYYIMILIDSSNNRNKAG